MREAKPLSLTETLMRLREGGVVEEIQSHIREATAATLDTGKEAVVTIKLKFKRNGDHNSRKLFISDQISSSLPKVTKDASILFANYDGDLSVSNPDQGALEGIH